MDTFNLHVENYLFAKFRNIWPKAIFHKDSAGSFVATACNIFALTISSHDRNARETYVIVAPFLSL